MVHETRNNFENFCRNRFLYCFSEIIFAEIFMLTDKSDNFSETWGFLKRRFADKAWLDEKLGFVLKKHIFYDF